MIKAIWRPRKRDQGPASLRRWLIVVRILEVMGFDLIRKSSGSVEDFGEDFSSAERRGASVSSDSADSTLKAVAVGVSIMVRVATTEP